MQEKQIVAAARTYLGVPFMHQGRSRAGLDCLGLLVRVAHDCQLQRHGRALASFDETHYGHYPDCSYLQQKLTQLLTPCQRPRSGAVLLLRHDEAPRHLAVVAQHHALAGELSMIHAYAPARKVVEHRLDAQWCARIAGCYYFDG